MATMNWAAVNADPRFRDLHRRKSRFLWGLMAISVVYYFLLPIGAAYCVWNVDLADGQSLVLGKRDDGQLAWRLENA